MENDNRVFYNMNITGRPPRILYWVEDKNLKRVFLPFKEDDRVVQAIVMPSWLSNEGLQIKTQYRYTDQKSQIKNIIDKFKPDMFVQCSSGTSQREHLQRNGIKHAFVAHGVWAKSETNLARVAGNFWTDFDLLCGAHKQWKEIFFPDAKALVVTNSMPQMDILYGCMQSDQDQLRSNILQSSTNPGADKIITLFGHKCKSTKTARALNEGFYRAAVNLCNLAEKHNWLLIIKPKSDPVNKYIKGAQKEHKWARELCKPYMNLYTNKYVKFVPSDDQAYTYFCSDVVVATHGSTVELEAILADKPLVRVYTTDHAPEMEYEFGTLDNGAAYVVRDPDELEHTMLRALAGYGEEMKHNREEFIESMGITLDGMAYKRVVDAILKVCNRGV